MNRLNPGVSVIICCHNSAKRLPETLHHLAAQQVPENISWEVIVVDNASTDETAALASKSASPSLPLRVVTEPKPGLRHARVKGIESAQYEILSFLDDDNWAANDWVLRVSRFFSMHPEVAVYGGRSIAETEIPPPPWFSNFQGYYAVGTQHAKTGDITNATGTLLYGAGLNLRAIAVRNLMDSGFSFLMSGREGNSLLAGEDTELCFALRAQGNRLWYDDDLTFRHFVAKERLTWNYVRRLLSGMGKASILIDLYLMALRQPPFDSYPAWKQSWLFQSLKILRHAATLFILHPRSCLAQSEGSSTAVRWIMHQGQLSMLWNLAGRYQKLKSSIAEADWAKPVRNCR